MEQKTELVIRLSALGDVAMTVSVIDDYAKQFPNKDIYVLTKERFAPLYTWSPENVHTIGINVDDYKGLLGLWRLYRRLRTYNFSFVADMHDVLRTKILRTFFRFAGVRVNVIDKGRQEKHTLIGHGLNHPPLKRMQDRYRETLGVRGETREKGFEGFETKDERRGTRDEGRGTKIGIAPFAAYDTKMYSLNKMKEVVDMLVKQGKNVFLFGGGRQEKEILDTWVKEGVKNMCGQFQGLKEELEFMKTLDVMLTMDSGNLHLASLMGVNTISIWGPTHPKAGFAPENTIIIQRKLDCRPCSIYGNKPCHKGTLECMNISPKEIIKVIIPKIGN